MFRTRFKKEIVAEFLPPERESRPPRKGNASSSMPPSGRSSALPRAAVPHEQDKVIILCDGMPSMPRKQALASFLAEQGYWVIYPRYRGAWESGGSFLERPPHEDILDVIGELPKGLREAAFGRRFRLEPEEIFVVGGSFGGAAALLASLDSRVKKVVAACPVVDWSMLQRAEKRDTSNPSYAAYIREAFGNGYRVTQKNWNKLSTGRFFNPMHHAQEITPGKVLMFHAKDDPYIPWRQVERFARQTGVKLHLLQKGGHMGTEFIVRKYWGRIIKFLESP